MRAVAARFLFPAFLLSWTISVQGQHPSGQPYDDPSVPVQERAEDLLSRMTPDEKFSQLFMIPGDLSIGKDELLNGLFGLQDPKTGPLQQPSGSAAKFNEIQRYFRTETRLGIPVIFFEEALHGLSMNGATSFPQAIALASTFDVQLMREISSSIADECLSAGIRQVLSPVVNITSDVRWGRTEETYGEDPCLVSEMGKAFVSGFEKRGVITTPKHFVANVGDGGRDSYPVQYSERALRSVYLPPFKSCITAGGSRSVMSSYNSLDGIPCTANPWLLQQILKKEWGFKGFVISDAGAVGGANVLHFTAADYCEATAKAINAGLDVILQTSFDHYPLFFEAFGKGLIPAERIDDAVRRVLIAKFSLGLFEDPYVDPLTADSVCGSKEHRELALKAARESIVLLKNDNSVLPLSRKIRKIAVIGPDAVEARPGGYSGPGNDVVNILDGIRSEAGPSVEVVYARGCERVIESFVPVPASCLFHAVNGKTESGITGDYFDHPGCSGTSSFTRTDAQVRFQWTLFGPDPGKLPNDFYSVRWTGSVVAPESGVFQIGIDGNDGYRMFLDGKLVIDRSVRQTRQRTVIPYSFEKGKPVDLMIEYSEPRGNAWFSLVWDQGVGKDYTRQVEEAAALASGADAAIVVAGIEEGEFRDRASLSLPGNQEELIFRISSLGKPVIVILTGGSAITMSRWLGCADAVLDAWYPGEAGGIAIAEILFGKCSPSGKLPLTFPTSEGQLPLVYNHLPTGRGDDYADLTGQPLFPFGFGLSYTTFQYSDLQMLPDTLQPGEPGSVSFTLTNTGNCDADEVVQLYIRDLVSSIARPVIELKAFSRIHLKKGESRKVYFQITHEMLSALDKDLKPVVEPGNFAILIGSSSQDFRLRGILPVL